MVASGPLRTSWKSFRKCADSAWCGPVRSDLLMHLLICGSSGDPQICMIRFECVSSRWTSALVKEVRSFTIQSIVFLLGIFLVHRERTMIWQQNSLKRVLVAPLTVFFFSFTSVFLVSLACDHLLTHPSLWAGVLVGIAGGVSSGWTYVILRRHAGPAVSKSRVTFPGRDIRTNIGTGSPEAQSSKSADGSSAQINMLAPDPVTLDPLPQDLPGGEPLRILGNIPDYFYSLDSDFRIIYVNQETCQIWGMKQEEMRGKLIWELFPSDHFDEFHSHIRDAVRLQKSVAYDKYSHFLRTWVEIRIYPTSEAISIYVRDIADRKRREIALRAGEEKLHQANELMNAVTSGTHVLIAAQDLNYRYTYFNEAYKQEIVRLAGIEIAIGTSMVDVFSPFPEQQTIATQEWAVPRNGTSTVKTMEFGDPGLYRRTYQVFHTPLRNALGAIVGVGEVTYDITDRVLTQESLVASEERYRKLFDSMLEGFTLNEAVPDEYGAVCDIRIVDVNPAFERMTGLSRDAVVGKTFGELLPESLPSWIQMIMDVLATGKPTQRIYCDPSSKRYYDTCVYALEAGKFALVFSDITDLKRSEETFQKHAEEYRSLMDEASDGIILTDSSGKPVAANVRIRSILGYAEDVLLATEPDRLLYDHSAGSWVDMLTSLQAGQSYESERVMLRSDGSMLDVEITATRLSSGGVQCIIRDITLRREKERKIRRLLTTEVFEKLFVRLRAFRHGESGAMTLNRLALLAENLNTIASMGDTNSDTGKSVWGHVGKDTFRNLFARFVLAASEYKTAVVPEIAHISALFALCDDGASSHGAKEEFEQTAEALKNQAEALVAKLDSLASYTPDLGVRIPDVVPVTLNSILGSINRIQGVLLAVQQLLESVATCNPGEVIESVQKRLRNPSSGPEIQVIMSERPRKAIIKPEELGTVLETLIINAVEAFGRGARSTGAICTISIEMVCLNDLLRITARDNGPGVPAELVDSIFVEGISSKTSGHGFGLPYAQKLLAKYGGRLLHDSASTPGATFIVELLLVNPRP
jgi:PAS domain S-box-containing protein